MLGTVSISNGVMETSGKEERGAAGSGMGQWLCFAKNLHEKIQLENILSCLQLDSTSRAGGLFSPLRTTQT